MTRAKSETEGDRCPHCPHLFDPHVLLAVDVMAGGIIRCPGVDADCDCESTWSPQGVPPLSEEGQAVLRQMWLNRTMP